MNLGIIKESGEEYPIIFEKILEDIPGGITFDISDLDSAIEAIKAGVLLAEDGSTAGLFHICKTAKTQAEVAAGATSVKVLKSHLFVVGDFITNGDVSTAITEIVTTHADYDTLTITATLDAKEAVPVDTVLYQGGSETSNSATASEAQVIDEATEILDITNPRGINGCKITISQAGDDNLAVASPTDGQLTIALANTTESKNNASVIQTAVRALGIVGTVNFTDWGFASDGWDGNVTGSGLTVPSDYLASGVEKPAYLAPKHSPGAILGNEIDVTKINPTSNAVVRGTVNESLLPYHVADHQKIALTDLIRFV